jgi:hypothetical protein
MSSGEEAQPAAEQPDDDHLDHDAHASPTAARPAAQAVPARVDTRPEGGGHVSCLPDEARGGRFGPCWTCRRSASRSW